MRRRDDSGILIEVVQKQPVQNDSFAIWGSEEGHSDQTSCLMRGIEYAGSDTGISAAKTTAYPLQFAKLLLALMRNMHRSRSVHRATTSSEPFRPCEARPRWSVAWGADLMLDFALGGKSSKPIGTDASLDPNDTIWRIDLFAESLHLHNPKRETGLSR
jgi:hypothetical protein